MKKGLILSLSLILSVFAYSQEWFIGANLNNDYMLYEAPIGPGYHAGIQLYAEKGLTFDNEWRIGLETGFSQSIGLNYVVTTPVAFPILVPLVNAYESSVNWVPAHVTLSFNGYKPRRKANMYGKLALGYAFGQTSTTLLSSVQFINGTPVVIPEVTTSGSWGGFSGAFRLGTLIELKQRTTYLDINLGYHALYAKLYTDYVDPVLINGVQLQIGIQYRFLKAR
jgi:hypothetical protein